MSSSGIFKGLLVKKNNNSKDSRVFQHRGTWTCINIRDVDVVFRQIAPEDGGAHRQGGSEVREAEMESPVGSQEDSERRQG